MWVAWLAPCIVAAAWLGLKTWSEKARAGAAWDPYYGASGPATRLLFSYFPNCFLPLYIAIAATIHKHDAWPLLVVVIVALYTLFIGNTTFTTGPRHYGFKWHIEQMLAMFARR
jgi:hypothetical protein